MPTEHNWYLDTRPFNYTTSFVDTSQLREMFGINEIERKENNMDVRDKICDKCGKRYSVANMRVYVNGEYTDKECYLENNAPIANYPKVSHSRADEKYCGREMDLCSECAEKLKKFAGEE